MLAMMLMMRRRRSHDLPADPAEPADRRLVAPSTEHLGEA